MTTNLAEGVIMIAQRRFIVFKVGRVMFRKGRLVTMRKRQPILSITVVNINVNNRIRQSVSQSVRLLDNALFV